MKPLLAILAFLAFAFVFGCALVASERRKRTVLASVELDMSALLEAIAQVESGNQVHAVSVRGERGRCQFIEATWYGYTNADFTTWAASGAPLVRQVEAAHYRALLAALRRLGLTPTPELVGAAWRHGAALASLHRNDGRSIRVGNLYRDFLRQQEGRR